MPPLTSDRFITLDVFRGMTVFLMIVVNTPGSWSEVYSPLLHAEWHGCTLTDLVFPSFLFAVGNAMWFAFARKRSAGKSTLLIKVLKRTILIFVIGFLLGWFSSLQIGPGWEMSFRELSNVRIMGVLQRIALAYGIAAVIAILFDQKKVLVISAAVLFLYWFLLVYFGDDGLNYSAAGNAVRKLDLLILGPNHMYREGNIAFDPEGLLSTLPSVVTVTSGYLAAAYIQKKGRNFETVAGLLIAGNLLILAGLFWSYFFPINKKLWTSSYVLFTSGIFSVAIGVLIYFYEIRLKTTASHFFRVFGVNPLFIYIFAGVLAVSLRIPVSADNSLYGAVYTGIFARLSPGPSGSLAFALIFALSCWFVGYLLDKKRIYIRV